MGNKQSDAAVLFAKARQLAESVVRDAEGAAGRAERLTAGLAALWPAPLAASLVAAPDGEGLAVSDETGRPRPDWRDALRPYLARRASEDVPAEPLPSELGLADHVLHGGSVAWGGRRYGAVALALPERTDDASRAQALLTHLADHLAFRLAQEEAERQAQSRYRDLTDLTNLVGHEFNNVLNAIGLRVAALGPKGLTSEHFPELADVRREVAAAGLMVRRLQDLCRQGSPPRQPADLNRAVRAALRTEPALVGRVHLALSPDLPPVEGTALDLERLAGALLRGAAAAPPGPGSVTVQTGRRDRAVWLRVEDAGPDPDEELLPRLFEPFVVLRAGDDGLTLALAKGIARRLGGNLRGERRAGGGMVFVAELRAAEARPRLIA